MTRIFDARILVWSPESSAEKTVLLAARTDERFEHLVEGILVDGPVTFDEPGFVWRTQPEFHGLFVWVGSIELDDETIFFDGDWEDPNTVDLSHMAGLNIQQIVLSHAASIH